MKITNVRHGFATNSSSLHSIIFDKDLLYDKKSYNDDFYGHEAFELVSKEEKLAYLATQLSNCFSKVLDDESAVILATELTKVPASAIRKYGIDHQSLIKLPKQFGTDKISMEFVKDLIKFLSTDGVAVLGGSDNVDSVRDPNTFLSFFECLKDICDSSSSVVRKDPKGFYSIFDTKTGRKVRFTLMDTDVVKDPIVYKSTYPELVDLKITNFCTKGCSFCYQNSTAKGKHADFEFIACVLDRLGDMNVFEVALGGGEPTEHPNFISILRTCKANGITPNFTTGSTEWLDSVKIVKAVNECVGAFAFSVSYADEVVHTYNEAILSGIDKNKIKFQTVVFPSVGGVSGYGWDNLKSIVHNCAVLEAPLTLLASKTKGRNSNSMPFEQIKNKKEILTGLSSNGSTLGVDTLFAKTFKEELDLLKVPAYLYEIEEGKHSMYIDAVKKTMAPSSYCDESLEVQLPVFYRLCDLEELDTFDEAFKNNFAKW